MNESENLNWYLNSMYIQDTKPDEKDIPTKLLFVNDYNMRHIIVYKTISTVCKIVIMCRGTNWCERNHFSCIELLIRYTTT